MIERAINIDRDALLSHALSLSSDQLLLIYHSDHEVISDHRYNSLWQLSGALYNFHPSQKIRAIIILSREKAPIERTEEIMDQCVIDLLLQINLNDESIPEDMIICQRTGNAFSSSQRPFFLSKTTYLFQAQSDSQTALLIIPRHIKPAVTAQTVKLLRDAGFTYGDRFILRQINTDKRGIETLLKQIEPKLEKITHLVFATDIDPSILARIEQTSGKKAIGREELIISIFEQRAIGSSGKLKVAASIVAREKILFKHKVQGLSRIKGGIGLKGPGETKEEERKRILKLKEADISLKQKKEKKRLSSQRKFREKSDYPSVAIVGYTNAGKSTLFNHLLNEKSVTVSDKYFSSIDPCIRLLKLFNRKLFLIDTVGLIEGLSQGTIDAFHPTFDEIIHARLILHIVDNSDPTCSMKREFVEEMLKNLDIEPDNIKTLYSKKELLSTLSPHQGDLHFSSFDQNDIMTIKKMIYAELFSRSG